MKDITKTRLLTLLMTALTVLLHLLTRDHGRIIAAGSVFAVVFLSLPVLGLRGAVGVCILSPWFLAALELQQAVITYPMIFANLVCILLLYGASGSLLALPFCLFARALVLYFMVTVVIGTWLEPYLSQIHAISYGRMSQMLDTYALWRQILTAFFGGTCAVITAHFIPPAKKHLQFF